MRTNVRRNGSGGRTSGEGIKQLRNLVHAGEIPEQEPVGPEIIARLKAFLQHAVLFQQGTVHTEEQIAVRVLLAPAQTLFQLARVPEVEELHRVLAARIVADHEIGKQQRLSAERDPARHVVEGPAGLRGAEIIGEHADLLRLVGGEVGIMAHEAAGFVELELAGMFLPHDLGGDAPMRELADRGEERRDLEAVFRAVLQDARRAVEREADGVLSCHFGGEEQPEELHVAEEAAQESGLLLRGDRHGQL